MIYDLLRHLIETNYLSYDLQLINVSVLGPNTYFLALNELLSTFLRDKDRKNGQKCFFNGKLRHEIMSNGDVFTSVSADMCHCARSTLLGYSRCFRASLTRQNDQKCYFTAFYGI